MHSKENPRSIYNTVNALEDLIINAKEMGL
jgi:hypothetical protein